MSKIEDAKTALGQLFIMGFNGLDLSNDTAAFISQANIGGVILFASNYENLGQVAELTNQVQECRASTDIPLWVSVDHEGGRVQRFKAHFTKIPDAAAIGAINSPKIAYDIGEVMAKELKSVGVNLNFAPVADILTNPKNPVIGNRSFGSDEDTVTKMVTAIVRGHIVNGVQACVKHFPGHGDTSVDSHFALPRVDTPVETLQDREFRPFVRAFKSRCAMVMTAHVLLPHIDPKYPATLSPKIIHELLRNQLRYSRIVISDDLEMKAITDHFGADEAPKLALEAGCDLLIYRSEAGARYAYSSLIKALDAGELEPELVLEAAERSVSLKKDFLLPYQPATMSDLSQKVGTPEHLVIIQQIPEKTRK